MRWMLSVLLVLFSLLALPVLPALPAQGSTPPVRFAVIADQTGGPVPGVYDSVLAEVARMDPDFIVTVGDQLGGYMGADTAGLRAEYDALATQYDRAFGPRWRTGDFLILTPGNHDITDDRAEPLWRQRVGPPSRRVDVLGVTVLVLDTSRGREGGLAPEALHWLEAELAHIPPERPVIVATHKPFFNGGVWRDAEDPAHRLFVQHGVDAVLAGHWHTYVYDPRGGVTYAVCGSSGGVTDGSGLANGEFVGFIWGTVRDGRITLTPISKGAVLAPDIVNATENRARNDFERRGLILSPFNLAKRTGYITVTTHNTGDIQTSDSLRWTVPPNWTVVPQTLPFVANAGESSVGEFELKCTDSPFPLPSISARIQFGRGKSVTASTLLRMDRAAQCPSADNITVDGGLSDGEWTASPPETLFMSADGGRSKVDPTEFFFAHNDRGLFLAARCRVAADHPVVADVSQHDGGIAGEDCVGWFLAPSDTVLYQIYVSPRAVVLDGRGIVRDGGDAEMDYGWNADYQVASTRGREQWSVEMFVPYETIGARTETERSGLRLNIRRKQPALKSNADWVPVSFDPTRLGRLELRE